MTLAPPLLHPHTPTCPPGHRQHPEDPGVGGFRALLMLRLTLFLTARLGGWRGWMD